MKVGTVPIMFMAGPLVPPVSLTCDDNAGAGGSIFVE